MKGKFISFCGLDGSGKTTQGKLLKSYIESNLGIKVTILPGYKPSNHVNNLKDVADKLGENYQEIFTCDNLSLSLLCDLWENTFNIILPALNRGEVVITERYWESSIIYAPILGANKQFIEGIVSLFPTPDMFIYLDVSPEMAHVRVINRAKEINIPIMPKENIEIMKIARNRYIDFAANYQCQVVDSENLSYNEVHDKIVEYTAKLLDFSS